MLEKEKFQVRGEGRDAIATTPFQNTEYVVFGEWALWVDHRPEVIAAVLDKEVEGYQRIAPDGFRLEVKWKLNRRGREITVLHAYPGGEGYINTAISKWNRDDRVVGAVFTSTSTSRTGRHTSTWCVFPDRSGRVGSEDELARPEIDELVQ